MGQPATPEYQLYHALSPTKKGGTTISLRGSSCEFEWYDYNLFAYNNTSMLEKECMGALLSATDLLNSYKHWNLRDGEKFMTVRTCNNTTILTPRPLNNYQ